MVTGFSSIRITNFILIAFLSTLKQVIWPRLTFSIRPAALSIFICLDAAGTETLSMFAISLTQTSGWPKMTLKIRSLPGSESALNIVESVTSFALDSFCIFSTSVLVNIAKFKRLTNCLIIVYQIYIIKVIRTRPALFA